MNKTRDKKTGALIFTRSPAEDKRKEKDKENATVIEKVNSMEKKIKTLQIKIKSLEMKIKSLEEKG